MAGSTLKGAGLGAITGFVGGQFIGAGANVAANVTQNIANQTVRHVAKAGVEAGVETVIDTGISVATGNPISLKNVATDYGINLVTNGSGSVSSKKSAKADVPKNKPKSGDVAVTKSRQSSTPVQQMSNPGPNKSRIPAEAVDGNGNKVYGEILEPGYIHTRPVKDVTSSHSQNALKHPMESANYAQKIYNNNFSDMGSQKYSDLVGEPINTIDDLSQSLKNGKISASEIPVEYINRDGNILILNTRTSQALTQADIPRSQWHILDRTGDPLQEALLDGQLSRNKLSSSGTPTVRKSGGTKGGK